jgi:GT2 family glycosyltransferase
VNSRIGIVVPTLGKRIDYLSQCIESINKAGTDKNSPFVVLVAPETFDASSYLKAGSIHKAVTDPGLGLAQAINTGFSEMPNEIEYINWLGDDDMLSVGSLDQTSAFLDSNPKTVMVFGGCNYVDQENRIVWRNSSGSWAVPLLRFGPDLIPQPGALFRRTAFESVGRLATSYPLAFDFELFIKLSKVGKISHLDQVLSSFRWHPESLSVNHRSKSAADASRVRMSHLPAILRPLSIVWEYPIRLATLLAGQFVTARAKSKSRGK